MAGLRGDQVARVGVESVHFGNRNRLGPCDHGSGSIGGMVRPRDLSRGNRELLAVSRQGVGLAPASLSGGDQALRFGDGVAFRLITRMRAFRRRAGFGWMTISMS